MEAIKNHRTFLGENPKNKLLLLTDQYYPRILVTFGGNDAFREPVEVDAESFIAVKGFKAKGKRISTFHIEKVEELEPLRFPDPVADGGGNDGGDNAPEPENLDPNAVKSEQEIKDELTGQLRLF